MERDSIAILAAAPVIMLILGSLYYWNREYRGRRILPLKALATFMAVVLALYAAQNRMDTLSWLVFAASLLCMTADVLLEIHFVLGGAVFGAGHICYIAAMLQRARPDYLTAAVFAVLLGVMLFLHGKEVPGMKKKAVPGVLYAILLCFMAAMSVTILAEQRSTAGLCMALGGILFFVSDNILVKSRLTKKKNKMSVKGRRAAQAVLLLLYYMSVYLIAASLLVTDTLVW